MLNIELIMFLMGHNAGAGVDLEIEGEEYTLVINECASSDKQVTLYAHKTEED